MGDCRDAAGGLDVVGGVGGGEEGADRWSYEDGYHDGGRGLGFDGGDGQNSADG